ncbi:MAG: hypothetical protein IKT31_08325 [Firmicutes bacterium]|nr:hypothetical protein [Bacillota bacterium]
MTLYESLMEYPRASLLELARLKGLRGVSRLRKEDLACRLAKHMLSPEVIRRYFQWLNDDEIALLPQAPELIYQSEFAVRAFDEEDGTLQQFFVLPEVLDVYYAAATPEFHAKRRKYSFLLSCLNVVDAWYGAVPLDVMMQLAAAAPELEITETELLKALDELPGELQNYHLLGGVLWHRDALDAEVQLLKDQQNGPFYIPTRDEIQQLGRLGYLPETDGASYLLQLLQENSSCREDAEELVCLVSKCIAAGCSVRDVMELLEPHMDDMTDAEKIMLVDPACRLYENTRLLIFRGHTRKELGIEF